MKLRRILAGFSAASIAFSCMTFSAFAATDLRDIVYPTDDDAAINDAFYSIGAMGYYMSQQWKWNQSEWVGINDEGKIEIEYKISKPLTDPSMEDKGSLGDMGVMILNLPEDNYPYNVEITDAKFTDDDGNVTEFPEINAITEATKDPESGWRIHIRPTDNVDEETGEVITPAMPEVAGWEEEGAFNGGTLSMTIDLAPAGLPEKPEPADDGSAAEKVVEEQESTAEAESAPAESKASSSKSDPGEADDGLGTGAIVGICAGAAALIGIIIAFIVAKKKQ